MNEKGRLLMYLLPSILMGTIIPLASLYMVTMGFNPIAATIIIVFSIVVAGVIAVVGGGLGFASTTPKIFDDDKEELNILRATVRAMVDETDRINSLLEQIRDVLRGEMR
ncbi:MAG: hypothetical protein C0180_05045 [Aciduliprofundum sp.]|nr:MAG: hypothetical protein C0180_05045 [Aciduliprofundum sp.]